MLISVTSKITDTQLQEAAQDLQGYIKIVVDIEQNILTAGGLRHVEGEQLLLSHGSKQENLWGGGFDTETGEVDFDSMINIRPNQGNQSREVLSADIRKRIEKIIHQLLR